MVSAYASASTIATPRAAQLLIADPTSQNALSTFLGGFLFAIVGIIALSTDFYGEEGRIILFIGTVAVVAVIAITLLRWIAHITGFGRMADVIDRVEDAAIRSMREFAAAPNLGGRPPITIPARAVEVRSDAAGYLIHVDVPALERAARTHDLEVHVLALPGTHLHPGRPLVRAAGRLDDAIRAELCRAFDLGRHRNYDQDPRLGLIALAEIGSARSRLPPTTRARRWRCSVRCTGRSWCCFAAIRRRSRPASGCSSPDPRSRTWSPMPSGRSAGTAPA
jgi:uncharacterized membrane protein